MSGGGAKVQRDVPVTAAMAAVAAWRRAPAEPVGCPRCDASGLAIVDRSARPHAEWYVLSCPACGYGETLHVPMAASYMPGD